jgi:macrolide transport system ATP-binding/permease protein
MALIELEQVSRHYDAGGTQVRALDGVSLRIEAGEMVAIMGASGSGKSTLMNLLGCLDTPSSGCLRVDGHDLAGLSPDATAALRRDTFGFIFQRYHLLPHLDAVANVELPALYAGHGRRERRERAIALLRRLGLGERLGHRPDALSGGQQQRVSIARALMNGGRIILADEPTGALDSASGAELLALLDELHALGHTVILVTHDAAVASRARRIIEMRDGRVVRDEPVRNDRPSAPRPPMPVREASALAPGYETAGTAGWLAPWREALAMSLTALNGSRLRSLLSMLGISIGIAAVVTIASLGEAARKQVERSAQQAAASTLTISRGNRTLPMGAATQPLRLQDVAALRALPGVSAVVPRYSSTVAARQGRYDDSVTANGIAAGELLLGGQVVRQGRGIGMPDLDARAQVVVLDRAAQQFLFAPGEPVLGRQVMLGALPFTVIGVAQPTYVNDSPFQPNFKAMGNVYVPQTTYSSKLDTRQEADMLTVHFASPLPLDAFRAQVRQRLMALHGGVEDFSLESNEMIGSIFTVLLSQLTGVLTAIASISLLVGGVGVMNIMLVSVSERTREIGIRMAVGARRRDVRRQFLVESVLLCCLGGLGGLALPWLASQAASFGLPRLAIGVSWEILGLALGTCTAIGLVFGNLPARSAARLSPVLALARD